MFVCQPLPEQFLLVSSKSPRKQIPRPAARETNRQTPPATQTPLQFPVKVPSNSDAQTRAFQYHGLAEMTNDVDLVHTILRHARRPTPGCAKSPQIICCRQYMCTPRCPFAFLKFTRAGYLSPSGPSRSFYVMSRHSIRRTFDGPEQCHSPPWYRHLYPRYVTMNV